jgi:acyl-CoA reductase-like NAD-dependent aldehyde dehydrogenase
VTTRKTTRMAAAPPTPPKPRGVRLRSSENVRAELARTYRAFKAGEISDGTARVRAYILQTLAAVIRDEKLEDIEAQLEELKAAGVLK